MRWVVGAKGILGRAAGARRRGPVLARWLAGALVCVAAIGCRDDDEPAGSEAEEYCAAICRFRERCWGDRSPTCGDDCLVRNEPFIAAVQPEYLGLIVGCWDHAQCDVESDTEFDECHSVASFAVTPTAAAYRFCATFGPRFFECGYDAGNECVEWYKEWSDSILTEALQCVDAGAACDPLNACLDRVLTT